MSDGNFARLRGAPHPAAIAVAAVVGGALAATAVHLVPPHPLTAWPLPLVHGAAGGVLAALFVEWLGVMFRANKVPNEPVAQRAWASALLGQCGALFGRRAVSDDPAGSVVRLVGLVRAQLADRWSLYAICGLLLGMVWMVIFLLSDDGPVPPEMGNHLLVLGFAQAAVVLSGSALLWMTASPRLRAWQQAALRAVAAAAAVAEPVMARSHEEARPENPPPPQRNQEKVNEPTKPPNASTPDDDEPPPFDED